MKIQNLVVIHESQPVKSNSVGHFHFVCGNFTVILSLTKK